MIDGLEEAIADYRKALEEVDRFEATEGVEHQQRRQTVYGARKAARNRVAQLLQDAGLTGFMFGRDS